MPRNALPKDLTKINIRPGVSVLSVLQHLNYKPWFALAEFVDNSVQNFVEREQALNALHGDDFIITVRIDVVSSNPGLITIKDNAAGIAASEFPRAFRPAAIPSDTSGLSEFGMGMKSAACWFSPRWSVRTKALHEDVERTVRFDVDEIVHGEVEELEITQVATRPEMHFTEVVLEDLHHLPVGRTVGKIKDHLTDIYRVFIRDGVLQLFFNDDRLEYSQPKVLVAPFVRDEISGEKRWEKPIEFDFGGGLKASGYAALQSTGDSYRSGFALFRRDRLIQGSADEGYKPRIIFGQPGSFRSQRLFGELHLEGFEVSHTKDGFRWDENEETFLEILKDELDADDLPLLRQADLYRALESRQRRRKAALQAVNRTVEAMEKGLPRVLPEVADKPLVDTSEVPLPDQLALARRELKIDFRGKEWLIKVELTDDPAESQWLAISDQLTPSVIDNVLEIRVSLAHPFMVSFAQTDPDDVEAMLRVAAGLALAERVARLSGGRNTGTIRRNLNDILRDALSKL